MNIFAESFMIGLPVVVALIVGYFIYKMATTDYLSHKHTN